jgi:biopolymer transport protein TolQ
MEEISAVSNINSENIDFSMLALFMSADYVVKSVIIILIIASLYSWSIIVAKLLRLRHLKQMEKEFEEIFWSGNSFEDLYETLNFNKLDPKSKIFCSAISEWKKSKSNLNSEIDTNISSLKDRMQRSMIISFNKESEILEKNLTFLATSGSTAPFIGLFGTVWGIMNSFKSIAVAQNTNLSVVAPGIAEALFATALGLFVAIPAVVAYNKISSDLSKYFVSLETFMDEFTTIFFRQLEKKTIDKY